MAQNTIKCTHCGKEVQITEALEHELEEKIEKRVSNKVRAEAIKKVRAQYDSKIEATKEESLEREEENKKLQEEQQELLKNLREAKSAESKLKIDYQKKLLAEQDKIKADAKREAAEELNIEMLSRDKKIADAGKQIEELKRKLEQGSQQLQGEVIELEIEEALAKEFPSDSIEEVPKGIRGADVIQKVITKSGVECGTIVWEIKNTKNWTESWIIKLKQDQRSLKAEIAIIVSKVLPENIENFGTRNNIWVTNRKSAISLAYALRQQLIKIQQSKSANEGKATKAEVVYDYLISNEFKQRIEVWVEYFAARRIEIDRERMYFNKKWENEEKNIIKVIENTAGIYGDLQGLIGTALPKISNLELPEEI